MGAVLAPIQFVIGDIATRSVFHDQPVKFAAMEITWKTQSHNPEVLGGLLRNDGTVQLGLSIPSLDSVLAGFSPNTVVRGLTSFSPDVRPNVVEANFVHLAFDVMVGLGSIACLLTLWYAIAWIRHRDLPRSPWFWRGAALAGIGSYLGIEAGWITTEVGRQPWIVYNLMRVSDAVTTASPVFVWTMFAGLLVAYAVIAFFFVRVLLGLSSRWRLEDEGRQAEEVAPEDAAPYGPRPA
jgi:cytochrome d ubiquinol oxidase subunit I